MADKTSAPSSAAKPARTKAPARSRAPAKGASVVNPGADPAPATKTDAAGAIVEPVIAESAVIDHPAVDNNPRENTTADQNRIDFNDPTKPGHEAVSDNLNAQKA